MIRVVTDSSANLPPDLVKAHGIRLVPAYLDFGGRRIREHVDITADQLHEYLATSPTDLPRPDAARRSDFVAVYDQLIADAPTASIVSIHVSGALSPTVEAARRAVEQYPGFDFHVIDSRSAGLIPGLMAVHAARLAADGASTAQVLACAADMASRARLMCLLDMTRPARTWIDPAPDASRPHVVAALEAAGLVVRSRHASRGDGLAALRDAVLAALRDTVLAALRDAVLAALRDTVLAALRGAVLAEVPAGGLAWLGVMHTAAAEAPALAADLARDHPPGFHLVATTGPAFGVYCGLGTVGVGWYAPAVP
jgi:fatty acid-binding protein DegV